MQILTPTGYKNIEDIEIGDDVIAYDMISGEEILNQLLHKEHYDGEVTDIIEGNSYYDSPDPTDADFTFYLINGTYRLFKNQSIWANGNFVTHVKLLQIGDIIYDENNEDVEITSIEEVSSTDGFWRLAISGDSSYIADGMTLHNASRFWVTGGVNNNWSTTGNWSGTSGGGGGSSVPSSADDVTHDSGGNSNCILNTATAKLAKTWTVTSGYTQTVTFDVNLTVSGSITLGVNMIFAGAGALIINGTGTMTSNGKTCGVNFQFAQGGITCTLADNWVTTGNLTTAAITIVNGSTFSTQGSLSIGGTSAGGVGTTVYVMTGTGTFSCSAAGAIRNSVTFNTAGTITISGNINMTACTITYTAGTLVTTGSTFTMISGSTTLSLDMAGQTIGSLVLTQNLQVVSLKSNIVVAEGFSSSNVNSASRCTVISDSGGTQRVFTLLQGATQDLPFVNPTDIDSSQGQTIYSYKGVFTNSLNWQLLTTPQTVASMFH